MPDTTDAATSPGEEGNPKPGSISISDLAERFGGRAAIVGIIGLGYVGLPLARAFANAGVRVLGFDVDDPRESPGFELMDLLIKQEAHVTYNDPHIPVLPSMRHYPNLRMSSQPLSEAYLAAQDCVLIATDHSAYDYSWIVEHSSLIVDTRNATRLVASGRDKIIKA